ncbi:MAG: hypothetical protein Q4E35_06575 [Eubacteriales bacterium]|nr:hypothetical protein [Eubacteriales bacterium]
MNTIIDFFITSKDAIDLILQFLTFALALIGGIIALIKWSQQIRQNRAEKVKELICKVRDDEDIAMIMDIIDWNDGFYYNGKFCLCNRSCLSIDDDTLFKKIDKTLSHFSYICYLKKRKVFSKQDIVNYEYGLRRLTDNRHIANYLYTIYHWSRYLNVHCSFHYLIDYSLRKGYLEKDFVNMSSKHYTYCLKNGPAK